MKISIAMATYNGAKYLTQQLQSFIDQSRRPDELVISDDCSDDKSKKIIDNFIKTAPFEVRFYQNEKKLGYTSNFNQAISKTNGDLVFISDQDDVWFPEKIAYIENLARRYPDKLLFMNNAALTDRNLHMVGLTKLGQIRAAGFLDTKFVMGCCCAVRRELLHLCMPIPDGYKAHDKWIVFFADGLKRKYIDSIVLQYYRRHGENESKFIANRITRLSCLKVFFHRFKAGLFEDGFDQKLNICIQQDQLFLNGVQRALTQTKKNYKSDLENLCQEVEEQISMTEWRKEIRSKTFFVRACYAIILWIKSGYRHFSGFKSAIRDVLGL